MRAVKSGKKKIIEGNKQIFQSVYKNFEPYQDDLYVLVIYEESKDLSELIKGNKVVEIMITNYLIKEFSDEQAPKYVFKVYTFEDYMNEVIRADKENDIARMNGYCKEWEEL